MKYGSYTDEELNEWERRPLNVMVLTSSAFGAWLLRRDKRIKEQMKLTIDIPKEIYQNAKTDMLCGSEVIVNAIKNGTPIEQKKGHWIRVDKTKVKCSNCEITHLIAQYPPGRIDYCPNCGAKMEG